MPGITIRNLSDEVYCALRVRATLRGRGVDAEALSILEQAVMQDGSVGLGSLLTAIGRCVELSDDELDYFVRRESASAIPLELE